MPTDFNLSFSDEPPDDTIYAEHVKQFASPINDLESGATWWWPTGGAGNSYTISPDPPLQTYSDGNLYFLQLDRANTGPVTLEVSGLGPKAVRRQDGNELGAGDLATGAVILVVFSGLYFQALAGLQTIEGGTY